MVNRQEQQSFRNVWCYLGLWWFTIQGRALQTSSLSTIITTQESGIKGQWWRSLVKGEFANPIQIDTWVQVQSVNDSKILHSSCYFFREIITFCSKYRRRIHGHNRSDVNDLEGCSTFMGSSFVGLYEQYLGGFWFNLDSESSFFQSSTRFWSPSGSFIT